MYDIIIIGAGPAGLTSALYARRANKNVLVLEAKSYGGQIANAAKIENYPGIESISGIDYATELYHQVKKLGTKILYETAIRVTEDLKVITNKNEYQAKSIIIATGVENRKLNIEREQELVGKGVSYCATCDGPLFKDKVVAVNGGGNTALEDALYLSNIAKKVYLVHRREEFRGEVNYVEELRKKDNIEWILNAHITSLNGKEKLESITVSRQEESEEEIPVDGLFIAIGHDPKNEIFKNVVELDNNGYIISSDGVHTDTKHVYVAGDARVKNLRQLVTAVSDGATATVVAIQEMKGEN